MSNYQKWWDTEGSAMQPLPNEDVEKFARRITAIAWSNGEFVECERVLKILDDQGTWAHIGDLIELVKQG
jgi:hypothetical protein